MNTEDGINRGTTSIYRYLAITAFKSVKQHSGSVTGTPVAAYLNNCSVHCWQDEFNLCFPVASHLPATLFRLGISLLVPAQNAFDNVF